MSLSQRQQAQFSIASQLLHDDVPHHTGTPLAWTNLGYWQQGVSYTHACEQLAQRLGEAAQLSADVALLDLGCGQGASVAYWQSAFAVQRMVALDIQQAHINQLQHVYAQHAQIDCVQGAFDSAQLPSPLTAHSMHAVICLDAAYHARSAAAFVNFCAQSLQDSGRLVFCTLLKSAQFNTLSKWQQHMHHSLLAMAKIPRASVLSAPQLTAVLRAHQFDNIHISDLSQPVLQGFAHYVTHRQRALSMTQRLSPAWQKIALTAQLCNFLYHHQAVRYVMVSAHKHAHTSP